MGTDGRPPRVFRFSARATQVDCGFRANVRVGPGVRRASAAPPSVWGRTQWFGGAVLRLREVGAVSGGGAAPLLLMLRDVALAGEWMACHAGAAH